jgi:hypothetical protein
MSDDLQQKVIITIANGKSLVFQPNFTIEPGQVIMLNPTISGVQPVNDGGNAQVPSEATSHAATEAK